MVCVLSKDGKPFNPTRRHGHVRKQIESGKAIVVKRRPFTIQLTYDVPESKIQPMTLGIDTGYDHIGVSVINNQGEEVFSAQVDLIQGEKERIDDRRQYRRNRRNRLRHRKKRVKNRKHKAGWLPPSIHHKVDSHCRLVENVKKYFPIREIHFEIDVFILDKMKNHKNSATDVKTGKTLLREFIFNRDGRTCQKCFGISGDNRLVLHHAYYWKGCHGDSPDELVTLCETCNAPANHLPGGPLYGWIPKTEVRRQRGATFMNVLAPRLMSMYPDAIFVSGKRTAQIRTELKLDKSHTNDAFIIAGGKHSKRTNNSHHIIQERRNNRRLETLRDAKYIDIRDGSVKTGKDLFSGRTGRAIPPKYANKRIFRGEKVIIGARYIRKQRYEFQAGDLVITPYGNQVVKGNVNLGKSLLLLPSRKTLSISKHNIRLIKRGRGFNFHKIDGFKEKI